MRAFLAVPRTTTIIITLINNYFLSVTNAAMKIKSNPAESMKANLQYPKELDEQKSSDHQI